MSLDSLSQVWGPVQVCLRLLSTVPVHRLVRQPAKPLAYEFRAMEALLDALQGQPAIILVDSTNISGFLNDRLQMSRKKAPRCVWRVLRKFRKINAQVIWVGRKKVNRYLGLSKRSKCIKDLLTR